MKGIMTVCDQAGNLAERCIVLKVPEPPGSIAITRIIEKIDSAILMIAEFGIRDGDVFQMVATLLKTIRQCLQGYNMIDVLRNVHNLKGQWFAMEQLNDSLLRPFDVANSDGTYKRTGAKK